MNRRVATVYVSAVAVLLIGALEAGAQAPGMPAYNPYLNLVRSGNPGVNYYGIVRPQIAFRNEVQQLQRTTTTLQSGVSQLAGGELVTGHPAGFMYFGGYYQGLGRGGLPARSLPSSVTSARPPATSAAGSRR
jgi:hypothetical protein